MIQTITRMSMVVLALCLISGANDFIRPAYAQETMQLDVRDAWARPSTTRSTAAYLTLHNPGHEDVIVYNAKTDVSATAEIHRTTADENGVMRMEWQKELRIAPKTTVEMKPGGLHVMVIGLMEPPLEAGQTFALTLGYADRSSQTIEVPVIAGK